MPTVRAGDLPYQPYNSEEPSPQVPSAYQNIRSTGADFGETIGAATEKLGAVIGQGANVLAEGAVERQKFENRVRADDATNNYNDAANKLLYGDPDKPGDTGFFGMKGENAVRALPDVRNQLLKLRDQIGAGLANPYQKLLFNSETRTQQSITMARMGAHYDSESKTYATAVATAKDKNAGAALGQALAEDNDPAAQFAVKQKMDAALDKLKVLGLDQNIDAVTAALQGVRSDYVKQKISILEQKDPVAALNYFENESKALVEADVIPLRNHLRAKAQAYQAEINAGNLPGVTSSERAKGKGASVNNPGSLAMAAAAIDPAIETAVAKRIATTSGLQHWAGIDPGTGKAWNPTLRAAFQSAGLPVDGPISEEQWNKADPLILKYESMGGQNVPNYRFDATHTAGGPHQITNSTWKAFGGPENFDQLNKEQAKQGVSGGGAPEVRLAAAGGDPVVGPTGKPLPKLDFPLPNLQDDELPDAQVPGMAERLEMIQKNVPADDVVGRQLAVQAARKQLNQQYRDQQRSLTAAKAQAHEAMEKREAQIYKDVYSDNPSITPQDVAADPTFDTDNKRRKTMIDLINDPPGSKIPPAQSTAMRQYLLDKMRLPEGDPDRITSDSQIYEQSKRMNKEDLDWLLKKHEDIRGPDGAKLAKEEDRFFKSVKGFITKSNPLGTTVDPIGDDRLGEYQTWVASRIADYKKEGKNPTLLFDRTNADYVGKPDIIKHYQPTMEESQRSIQEWSKGGLLPLPPAGPYKGPALPKGFSVDVPPAGGRGAPVVEAPIPPLGAGSIPARLPGETPDAYEERLKAR